MKIIRSLNKNSVLKRLKRKIYLNQVRSPRAFCAAREHFLNFNKVDLRMISGKTIAVREKQKNGITCHVEKSL